jgi:hypothetical protein
VLLASFWRRKITGSEQVRNRSTTGPYLDGIRRVKTVSDSLQILRAKKPLNLSSRCR